MLLNAYLTRVKSFHSCQIDVQIEFGYYLQSCANACLASESVIGESS